MDLRIAKYKDLINIPVIDNGEDFLVVNYFDKNISFGNSYTKSDNDMIKYFNGKIIVRKTVARKLAEANKNLKKDNQNLVLYVTYGYRLLETQVQKFNEEFKKLDNNISEKKRIEIAHKKIAVPEVAGHPTGGAVDITILNKKTNKFLDMGCKISDFSSRADKLRATYSKRITRIQKKNRLLLYDLLVEQEFCPFYEEWWHFSYGEKEWAWFYGKKKAIYEQKNKDEIKILF
jgi:D-alanyl-D-alanine dipeptidase